MKKIALALALLIPAPAFAGSAANANDASWREALLGTWQAVESPTATQVKGMFTLTPDGKSVGYTTANITFRDGTSNDIKVNLNSQWKLENGVLTFDKVQSDPQGFIPSGHVKRFQIKSITPTGMVIKDLSDGEELYRRKAG